MLFTSHFTKFFGGFHLCFGKHIEKNYREQIRKYNPPISTYYPNSVISDISFGQHDA